MFALLQNPSRHGLHSLPLFAPVSFRNVPSGHGSYVREELPFGQKKPSGQGVVHLSDLPGSSLYVPALQSVQSSTDVAFTFCPKVPAGHGCSVPVLELALKSSVSPLLLREPRGQ